jgi:hypothetical protein
VTLNKTDAIVPGVSAAGVTLGEPITRILSNDTPLSIERVGSNDKYVFDSITVWAETGRVQQVGVRAPYSGLLLDAIGIGSTIADVERQLGVVSEDDDDNLIVAELPGWCFETEDWLQGRAIGKNGEAKISGIFVFAVVA